MKKLLALGAVSMWIGCTTNKSDLKAFCNAPAAMPRLAVETSEQYVERIFMAAASKLTNRDAISAVKSLGVVGTDRKPDLLRANAHEEGLKECALADLWEWELVLGETRPRPNEGVRLVFMPTHGGTSFDRGQALAKSARVRVDALGLKDTRIITAQCPAGHGGCVAVETASVDQASNVEAALTDADETLSLHRIESAPIHEGTL